MILEGINVPAWHLGRIVNDESIAFKLLIFSIYEDVFVFVVGIFRKTNKKARWDCTKLYHKHVLFLHEQNQIK